MPNEKIELARAIVDEAVGNGTVPDEVSDGVTLADLLEFIQEVADDEIKKLVLDKASEEEHEEMLGSAIERISIRVGLVCLSIGSGLSDTTVSAGSNAADLVVSAEDVTSLFTELFRQGAATVTISVT